MGPWSTVGLSALRIRLRNWAASLHGPIKPFGYNIHALYVHLFAFHSIEALQNHGEMHTFSTESQELLNKLQARKIVSCSSNREGTLVSEVLFANLRAAVIPVSTQSLRKSKPCPKCAGLFVHYGSLVNHLITIHAFKPYEVLDLIGSKRKYDEQWTGVLHKLCQEKEAEITDSYCWKTVFSGKKCHF